MQWYSAEDEAAVDRIDAAWSDAPIDNEELLGMLLDVAREQVIGYAPAGAPLDQVTDLMFTLGYEADVIEAVEDILDGLVPGEDVAPGEAVLPGEILTDPPVRYVFAQLQQAKNLFNAGRIVGDSAGAEGFSFVPRPLSKEIQKIIRPQSGVASVL